MVSLCPKRHNPCLSLSYFTLKQYCPAAQPLTANEGDAPVLCYPLLLATAGDQFHTKLT